VTAKITINLGGSEIELVEEDVTTLFDAVEAVANGAGDVLEHLVTVKQLAIAKGVFTEPKPKAEPASAKAQGSSSRPASSDAPECKHGPMADYADRGYAKRWYCTKKGKDKECWAKA
jgi:hypothetical protein